MKSIKTQNKYFKDLRIYDIVLLFFCLASVMFENAFLFNPLILACFYLSYNRGLNQFILCTTSMIGLAMLVDVFYALELFIVFFTFFVANYLILRVSTRHNRRFYGIAIVNFFLLISTLIVNFSMETVISLVTVLLVEFMVIYAFTSFRKLFEDDKYCISIIGASAFYLLIAFSCMFFVNVGLLFFRFIILLVAATNKKETTLLTMTLSFVALTSLFDYSFVSLVIVFLPLVGYLVIPKYKEYVFVALHIGVLFLVETPIFYNAHFYQGTAAILMLLILPKHVLDSIKTIANRSQHVLINHLINQEIEMKQQLLYVTNYLDIVEDTSKANLEDPLTKGTKRVQMRVCGKCSHSEMCPLRHKVSQLIQDKIPSFAKKEINETCLFPYKLTMELQQAFHIFVDEQSYYYEALEKENQYRFAVKKLVEPVKNLQNADSLEKRIRINADRQQVRFKNITYKNDYIIATLFEDNFQQEKISLLKCLNSIEGKQFYVADERYSVLLREYVVIFTEFLGHSYEIGVVSKALEDGYNGDTYAIIENNSSLHVMISDGMGHGEAAMNSSQYLIKAMKAQINISSSLTDIIKETNNLMLIKGDREQYATLDYIRIDLKSLASTSVKAGCYASYLFRENQIRRIDTIGIPLGIISSIEAMSIDIELMKDDIIVLTSDGLGDYFETHCLTLTPPFEGSVQEFTRNVFKQIEEKYEIKDDATIIMIKIM